MQLQIENTNHCQAACLFCSYPKMQRAKGIQPMALTRKILDEAADIPLIDLVTFTGLGEPLLDKQLIKRVTYAKRVMPAIPIGVYTNGSLLTRDWIDAVIEAGLSQLYVSLNSVRREQRKAIMALDDFDRVVEMCDYARTRVSRTFGLIVKGVASKDLLEIADGESFRERWGGWTADGGSALLHLEGNWAGRMWPMRVVPTQSCARALGQFMVLWDGRVALCCFDGEGEEILGDLNTQTIREVYNHGRALEIRRAHVEGRRGDIPLCRNCTSI